MWATGCKLSLLLIVLGCLCLTAGCAVNLGAADEQLDAVYPEEFFVNVPRDSVWPMVKSEAAVVSGARILANSDADHVISWTDTIQAAQSSDSLAGAEAQEVGAGGCAITTVYVWSVPGGSRFRIHRVYYGPKTAPALSRSRGLYEIQFYHRVCSRLGTKG